MTQIHIKQTRIRSLNSIRNFSKGNIKIGVPVLRDEAEKVDLINIGDLVLPSGKFGAQSRKNAYGYSYADKTKPKEWRCVATIMIHPYGNQNAPEQPVDITRECYQKVEVSPFGNEFKLVENFDGEKFVMVDLDEDYCEESLIHAINLMLEIYGECYLFDEDVKIKHSVKRTRKNWEFLPKGERPSKHLRKQLKNNGKAPYNFDVLRLDCIEEYEPREIAEGLNGFKGYYAFLLDYCCVLESAFYGNATYIIPKNDWEKLSQKSKKELLDEDKVLAKIIHNENWNNTLSKELEKINKLIKQEK